MYSKLITRLSLVTVISLSTAAQAFIYIEARCTSMSQASPQGLQSNALIQNGVLVPGGSNSAGPNGSTSAGPIGVGVTTAYADTSQIDGPVLTTCHTKGDLSLGNLEVYAQAGGGPGIGASISFGTPRWTETITFNNTNPTPVELDFYWDTDGLVVDQSGPTGGSIDIMSSITLSIVNDANWKDIHFKGAPAFYLGGCQFIYSKQFGSYFGFQPAGNNEYGAWTTTAIGSFSGLIKATLIVPSGVVSIDVVTFLQIDARTGAICDYTDGAKFRFGTLPPGLSWTSASGVFLSAVAPLDSDGDGTPDAQDGCPNDPNKTAPGMCGCGVVDADTDGDGVCDYVDGCPNDPNKTSPGSCGCGVVDADADSDGVCDNVDNCPNVANPNQADSDGNGQGDACRPIQLYPPGEPQPPIPVCGAMGTVGMLPLVSGLMLMLGRARRARVRRETAAR